MNHIYLTRAFPGPGTLLLSEKFRLSINSLETPPARKELIANVENKDAILCTISDRIDKEVMEAAGQNLRVVSTCSSGYDHIDVYEATERGIYVTFTGNVAAEATADLTFGLILTIARRIVEADRFVRKGLWTMGWHPTLFLGSDVYKSTLGILGMGAIGSAVARRARGFNMNVIYHDRTRKSEEIESMLGARYVGIDALLRESDFLSINACLNEGSFQFIDKSMIRRMKRTAFLINTARGNIINESDLVYALTNNWIAGAALDTFMDEPLSESNALLTLPNVILLPHIGCSTYSTRSRMSEIAALNIINVLEGNDPIHLANPEVKGLINNRKIIAKHGQSVCRQAICI